MHFANPGLLGTRSGFDERYAQAMASGQATAAQALRARIRPFVLRRRKQEVAPELPPRTERLMFATLDESEREQYEALRLARRKDVVERLERDGEHIAVLILKKRVYKIELKLAERAALCLTVMRMIHGAQRLPHQLLL